MSTSNCQSDMEIRKSTQLSESDEEYEIANVASGSDNSEKSGQNDFEHDNTEEIYANQVLKEIDHIRREVEKLEEVIREFCGKKMDEQYRKLDETLMQYTIKLDNIETKDINAIKTERRKIILYIQNCLKELDSRTSHVSSEEVT